MDPITGEGSSSTQPADSDTARDSIAHEPAPEREHGATRRWQKSSSDGPALGADEARRLLAAGMTRALDAYPTVTTEVAEAVFEWAAERLAATTDPRAVDPAWMAGLLSLVDRPEHFLPERLEPALCAVIADERCPDRVGCAVMSLLMHQAVVLPAALLARTIDWVAADLAFDPESLIVFAEYVARCSHGPDDPTSDGLDVAFTRAALAHGNRTALQAIAECRGMTDCRTVRALLAEDAGVDVLETLLGTTAELGQVHPAGVEMMRAIALRFPQHAAEIARRWPLIESLHPAALLELADDLPSVAARPLARMALERMPELAGSDLLRLEEATIDHGVPAGWERFDGEDDPYVGYRLPSGDATLAISTYRIPWHGPMSIDDLREKAAEHAHRHEEALRERGVVRCGGHDALVFDLVDDGDQCRSWWWLATGTPWFVFLTYVGPCEAASRDDGAIADFLATMRVIPIDELEPAAAERDAAVVQAHVLGDLARELEAESRAELESPEWQIRRPIHTALLVEALSFGLLAADFWFAGYRVPPELESVLNWVAFNVQREFPNTFATLSLREVEERYLAWLSEHPAVREWNRHPARNDAARHHLLAHRNATGRAPLAERPFLDVQGAVRHAVRMVEREWVGRVRSYRWLRSGAAA